MKTSHQILQSANITPRLKLAVKEGNKVTGTGPHKVKMLMDKEAKGTDPMTGQARDEVAYLVEEDGVKKSYRVPKLDSKGEVHYLVQRLAEIEENEWVVLEYRRSGIKGFIHVERVKDDDKKVGDVGYGDIPIVEE